jgi:hypothetical protein
LVMWALKRDHNTGFFCSTSTLQSAKPTQRVFCQFDAFRPALRAGRQLHALAANSMLWRPTLRSDRQLYALEANSMLWPPTPCVSPQLHQATSRPGFHGAWWYRSRTTRVLRDPPPARGKRQGGDDGRTKTTPQHRGRNERGRGPSLRARAPRGLHARRVSHGHTREPCLARRLECGAGARRSCLASPRGSRREERRAIRREEKKEAIHPHPPTLLGCGGESRQTTRPLRARARVSRASPIAMRARVGSLRAQR